MIQAILSALLNFFRNLWNDYEARKVLKELGAAEVTIKTQEIINEVSAHQATIEPPLDVADLVSRLRMRASEHDNAARG